VDGVETYTVTAAAKLIGATRQTVYNHIRKDPDGLTIVLPDGKRVITLQGLGILKERLEHKPGKWTGIDKATDGQNHPVYRVEIDRLTKLVQTQENELNKLADSVKELNVKVKALEEDKAFLKDALNKALDRGSIWGNLFKRKRLTNGKD
jgi:predicted transcriptional regulator